MTEFEFIYKLRNKINERRGEGLTPKDNIIIFVKQIKKLCDIFIGEYNNETK